MLFYYSPDTKLGIENDVSLITGKQDEWKTQPPWGLKRGSLQSM